MKSSTSIALQQIGLQILISIPLYYLIYYFLFGNLLYASQNIYIRTFRISFALLLFTFVFWGTLSILKDKIKQTNVKSFLWKVTVALLVYGLIIFLQGGGLLAILYAPISYIFGKQYLKN